jgi:hypothetical protein
MPMWIIFYLIIGVIASVIGLAWWQTAIIVFSVLAAEGILKQYER